MFPAAKQPFSNANLGTRLSAADGSRIVAPFPDNTRQSIHAFAKPARFI
jgi:hypothetical protein